VDRNRFFDAMIRRQFWDPVAMKVFLSHTSEDRQAARILADELEQAGFEVWSADLLLPGDNWADELAEALRSSDAMVVLISPSSVRSEWIRREIEYALGTKRFEGRMIPVLIAPTRGIPWILERLHMLDAQRGVEGVGRQIARELRRSA